MDLLHLRALLNEQWAHDTKPVAILTTDGQRHIVTGLSIDADVATLITQPVEEP